MMPKRDLVCRARAKLTSSSPDLSLFDCGFSNATNAVSIIAFPAPAMAFKYTLGVNETKSNNLWRSILAEFIGIFILNFFSCAACSQSKNDYVLISLAFGLSVFMAAMVSVGTRFEIGSAADGLEFRFIFGKAEHAPKATAIYINFSCTRGLVSRCRNCRLDNIIQITWNCLHDRSLDFDVI